MLGGVEEVSVTVFNFAGFGDGEGDHSKEARCSLEESGVAGNNFAHRTSRKECSPTDTVVYSPVRSMLGF